jgi:hypothetical protein
MDHKRTTFARRCAMTTITDRIMTSPATPHTARRIAVRPSAREYWRCSWLPDRSLDRNQAITAMTIAEHAIPGVSLNGGHSVLLAGLAAELDLTWTAAARLIAQPPHVLDRRFHTLSTACWCQPATAWDGHRNGDGTETDFVATDADPIDADGYPLEDR